MISGTFRKPRVCDLPPGDPAPAPSPAPPEGGTLHMLPLGPREEGMLLAQLRAGESQAFEMLYHHYAGRVLGLARHMLRDPVAAEDATQETFIRIYRSVHRFRGDARLATWIHRIATNVCLTEMKRRQRRDRSTRAQREVCACTPPHPPRRPGCDLRLSLSEVLAQLAPRKRLTFYLCHVEGLSAAEIASVTGESTDAVHKRLQRTRRELHALWTEGGPPDRDPERGRP